MADQTPKRQVLRVRDRIRKRFEDYVNKCLTTGYLPYTFLPFQMLGKIVAIIWCFVQVGRVHEVNKHLLEPKHSKQKRVRMYCPNHTSMLDAIVMYVVMRSWARYMCAVEEMRIGDPDKEREREKKDPTWKSLFISFLSGLKTISMGLLGCFAVNRKEGHKAIEPMMRVLHSGQDVVLFPAGKINKEGRNGPFKTGAARAGLNVYYELNPNAVPDQGSLTGPDGQPIEDNRPIPDNDGEYVPEVIVEWVPVHLCFGKRDNDTAASGNFFAMGLKWRGDVTVTYCHPIRVHEVPRGMRNKDDITIAIRGAISDVSCPTTPSDDIMPEEDTSNGDNSRVA